MKTVCKVTVQFTVTRPGPGPNDAIFPAIQAAEREGREVVRKWLETLSSPNPDGVQREIPMPTEFLRIEP